MRPLTRLAVLAVVIVATAAACRQYLPESRYLGVRRMAAPPSTADARNKFNHQAHAAVLAQHDVTCVDCHRFDVTIDSDEEQTQQQVLRRAEYPGSAPCHFCHRPGPTHVASAPSACTTCHENLEALMPESHKVAWLKVHANVARTDSTQCETCHHQSFCIDCHERRDTIQTRVHERNFRFFHSVEARANPMKCGSCHREDFCIRCHQQGNVQDTF